MHTTFLTLVITVELLNLSAVQSSEYDITTHWIEFRFSDILQKHAIQP